MQIKLDATKYLTISGFQKMRMRTCHLFCTSMHQYVPYGAQQDLNNLPETFCEVIYEIFHILNCGF